MTEQQIQLIQRSFLKLLPQTFDAGTAFYERLFEIAPQVKPLFGENMSQQSKKLMRMLGIVVDGLYDFEQITQQIIELGERHQGYNVKPEHYPFLETALLAMLRDSLGAEYNEATEIAWKAALNRIKDVMFSAYK